MSYKYQKIGGLKKGKLLIDPKSEEACKIMSIRKIAPCKHGKAKAILKMVGIFTNQQKELILPADKKVRIPIVDKRVAQLMSINSDSYSLMDCESYESFEVGLFDVQDFQQRINEAFNKGKVVYLDYRVIMNMYKIDRIRDEELFP